MTLLIQFIATLCLFTAEWLMFPQHFQFSNGVETVILVTLICFIFEVLFTAITAITINKAIEHKPTLFHQIYKIGIIIDIVFCILSVFLTANICPDFKILNTRALIITMIIFLIISLSDLRWTNRFEIY